MGGMRSSGVYLNVCLVNGLLAGQVLSVSCTLFGRVGFNQLQLPGLYGITHCCRLSFERFTAVQTCFNTITYRQQETDLLIPVFV